MGVVGCDERRGTLHSFMLKLRSAPDICQLVQWTIFKDRRLSMEILIRCLLGDLHLIGNILWISVTHGLGFEQAVLNGTDNRDGKAKVK